MILGRRWMAVAILAAAIIVCPQHVRAQESKLARTWNKLQVWLDSLAVKKVDKNYIKHTDKPWRFSLRPKLEEFDMTVDATIDHNYARAKGIKDICPDILPNEIAIVEYPNLDDNSISPALLNMGTVNLLVTRANRTWKDVDQKALKELNERLEDKDTLFMYLTECQRYAVEEFVGQLPPYTKFNNLVYRLSQMGLTAVENTHAK